MCKEDLAWALRTIFLFSLRGLAGWGAALVALRGDQDHRVGSFDILVEKSCTLFSGVELVSFNFGRSRLSHPPFHPRVVRRVMVEVLSTGFNSSKF